MSRVFYVTIFECRYKIKMVGDRLLFLMSLKKHLYYIGDIKLSTNNVSCHFEALTQ